MIKMSKEFRDTYVGGEKTVDEWMFIQCPECGYETDIISVDPESNLNICPKCDFRFKDKWYKKKVEGFICNGCGEFVPDRGVRERGVMCPKCHGLLTLPIMHHGAVLAEFTIDLSGTDYFWFIHQPCNSRAEIIGILMDEQKRIIFTLKCPRCNRVDALKTAPIPLDRIYKFKKVKVKPWIH